jgi:hypothetical protein
MDKVMDHAIVEMFLRFRIFWPEIEEIVTSSEVLEL